MYQRIFGAMMVLAAVAGAQSYSRRATIVGGGDPNNGQCTVEVVVDGAAEVEMRGANATLRNLSGQPPQWRRFECTSVMPSNPGEVRFAGVDGRGKQELVADPRNGGAAVVRIEDPEGGAAGYTFQVTWAGYSTSQDRVPPGARDDRGFPVDRGQPGQRYDRPFPADRQPEDAFHRERDARFRGNDSQSVFFQNIREDLDHVTSGALSFNGDRARLARTEMDLDELQLKLSQGFYDQQELDQAMGAMRNVLQTNRLSPRDRSVLTDDLTRMRDFRMRHNQYGARALPDIEGVYHQDRDQRFGGDNGRAIFFQRIREDLDHVASTTFPWGNDQARLARTKFQLNELQTKLAQGVYDERELDEVMGAMQGVVASNQLRPTDRDILNDDLNRLRDFRVRHDQFGAR